MLFYFDNNIFYCIFIISIIAMFTIKVIYIFNFIDRIYIINYKAYRIITTMFTKFQASISNYVNI